MISMSSSSTKHSNYLARNIEYLISIQPCLLTWHYNRITFLSLCQDMWKSPENQFSEEKNITSHLFHGDSLICLYHFSLLEFNIWSWNIIFFSCYLLTIKLIKSSSLHHQIQGHQMSPSKKSQSAQDLRKLANILFFYPSSNWMAFCHF